MSDATKGDISQDRPGMSGDDSGSERTAPFKKRNRRGRRKRSAQSHGADDPHVQADTAAVQKGISPSGAVQNAQSGTADEDLAASKNSKRSRRRRNWRRKKQKAAAKAANPGVVTQLDAVEPATNVPRPTQVPQASSPPERNRRRTRRPNRDKRENLSKSELANPQQKPGPSAAGNVTATRSNRSHVGPNHRAGPRRQQAKYPPPAYAALDLGTNNCRLLMAVPQAPGRFRVVDAFSRIVRLGEGLGASGRLSDAAMDRAVDALKVCAGKLTNRPVKSVRLIATEACRRAENGSMFLQRVEKEAGLKLEIVDRETEARLAVAGCASLVDRRAKGVVLFDIGGGSSELALLDLRKRERYDLGPAMVSWTSLPLGVVTLSEKHGGGREVTRAVFDAMVDEVISMLDTYEGRDALAEAANQGEVHLLGTSGTVTTLAGIHLKLPKYDRRRVDGTWMDSIVVDEMIDALVEMGFDERVKNPCIGKDRADLVLAGCAILVAIRRCWPCPRLRVADRGLREGLLTEMMNADNAWVRKPNYFRHKSAGKT